MARLKKTVTKEVTGLPGLNRANSLPSSGGQMEFGKGQASAAPGGTPQPMSMMEALQAKIKQRFAALYPEREEDD
jgi:hypothetical protein